jgi:hypothetical protein
VSHFTFKSVQSLAITAEDQPSIDIQNNQLILTAHRNGEVIQITAPVDGLIPRVAKTTIKSPVKKRISPLAGRPAPITHHLVGTNNPNSKLNEAKVREIRQMYANKELAASYNSNHAFICAIARTYCIHFGTIMNVVNGISWKHVKN